MGAMNLHARMFCTLAHTTSLFPQDLIQDIFILHWNEIPKSIGVE